MASEAELSAIRIQAQTAVSVSQWGATGGMGHASQLAAVLHQAPGQCMCMRAQLHCRLTDAATATAAAATPAQPSQSARPVAVCLSARSAAPLFPARPTRSDSRWMNPSAGHSHDQLKCTANCTDCTDCTAGGSDRHTPKQRNKKNKKRCHKSDQHEKHRSRVQYDKNKRQS